MNGFDEPFYQDFGSDFGMDDANGETAAWMFSLIDPSRNNAWPPDNTPLDPSTTMPLTSQSYVSGQGAIGNMWSASPYQTTDLEDTPEWNAMLADEGCQAAAYAPRSFHNRIRQTALPHTPLSVETIPEDNHREHVSNTRRADSGIGNFDDVPDWNSHTQHPQWTFDQAAYDARLEDDYFHTDHTEEHSDGSQHTGPLQYHLITTRSRTNIRNAHSDDSKTEICPLCPGKQYTGTWAHRNLTRHMETMHAPCASSTGLKQIRCSLDGCGRTFRRDDARLVHERRSHPELNRPPAAKRKRSDDLGKGS